MYHHVSSKKVYYICIYWHTAYTKNNESVEVLGGLGPWICLQWIVLPPKPRRPWRRGRSWVDQSPAQRFLILRFSYLDGFGDQKQNLSTSWDTLSILDSRHLILRTVERWRRWRCWANRGSGKWNLWKEGMTLASNWFKTCGLCWMFSKCNCFLLCVCDVVCPQQQDLMGLEQESQFQQNCQIRCPWHSSSEIEKYTLCSEVCESTPQPTLLILQCNWLWKKFMSLVIDE